MNMQSTCCVTGHRNIPIDKIESVRNQLKQEIRDAIGAGYTNFITGGAEGVDLIFAELVLAFRDQGQEITLEADIPYRNRLKSPNAEFQRIIAHCNTVNVIMEQYQKSCFHARNRDMVQKSSRVIAVYDGRERGGTAYTICYARAMCRDIRMIEL